MIPIFGLEHRPKNPTDTEDRRKLAAAMPQRALVPLTFPEAESVYLAYPSTLSPSLPDAPKTVVKSSHETDFPLTLGTVPPPTPDCPVMRANMGITRSFFPLLLMVASFHSLGDDLTQDPTTPCFASLADNPDFQILKGKMDIGGNGNPPLDLLANTKKPTKMEKTAISKLVTANEICIRLGEEWRAKNWPKEVASLLDQYLVLAKSRTADLYARKITYGEYAQADAAALAKYKADLSEIAQKLTAQQKATAE